MLNPTTSGRHSWLLPLLALVAFAALFQGARPLFDPDEGRYTAVSLEMIRTGDWLHPQLSDDLPHWSKPPLTYWLVAGSIQLFGRIPFAVRLPNTLAFIATVLLVFGMGRLLVPEAPRLPALIYATCLLPFVAASMVTTDTLLTFCETLAVYGFVRYRFDPDQPRSALVTMWVGFGLAFLTKGPPGLLPLLVIVVFVASVDGFRALPKLASLLGLAAFAVLGFGWFLVVVLQQPSLLSYFMHDEVMGRVLTNQHNRNASLWRLAHAYLPPILLGTLPWGAIVVRRWWKARPSKPAVTWDRASSRFLLLWVAVPLVIFLLSRSRLPLYLLPLCVPAALWLARRLVARPSKAGTPMALPMIGIAVWVCVLLGLRLAGGWVTTDRDTRWLADAIHEAAPAPTQEVVFVDSLPLYTLAFHLNAEIERVNLHLPLEGTPEAEYGLFSEELQGREEGSVFLVRQRSLEELHRQATALGFIPVRIGEADRYHLFLMAPPLANSAANSAANTLAYTPLANAAASAITSQ